MLADAVASGLASTGTDVDRLGTLPTPGAQYYAERESVPVIVVTASHNPPQYNGIKLVGADGVELAVSDLERIEETLLAEGLQSHLGTRRDASEPSTASPTTTSTNCSRRSTVRRSPTPS